MKAREQPFEQQTRRRRIISISTPVQTNREDSNSSTEAVPPRYTRGSYAVDLDSVFNCAACLQSSTAHSSCHHHRSRPQSVQTRDEFDRSQLLSESRSGTGMVTSSLRARQKCPGGRADVRNFYQRPPCDWVLAARAGTLTWRRPPIEELEETLLMTSIRSTCRIMIHQESRSASRLVGIPKTNSQG
jgi:hypothetical protein